MTKLSKLKGKRGKLLATLIMILFLISIPAFYNIIPHNSYETYSTYQKQILYNSQNTILTKETAVDDSTIFSLNPFPNNTIALVVPIQISSYKDSINSDPILQSPGSLTVTGYLYYYDNIEGLYYPCRYATAELWDDDLLGDDLLYTGMTNYQGYFTLGPVDNTDGEGGTQDIYVKIYTDTAATRVYDGIFTYAAVTPTVNDVPDGTYSYGYQEVASVQRGAWNIYDQIINGYQWVDGRPNTDPPPKATVKWYQGNDDGTHYHLGGEIHILGTSSDPDEFDDGIILHEYGHFIAYNTWSTKPYRFDNSPGGSHTWAGTYTPELAWSEGWAHYFACIVRSSATYRDTFSGGWVEYNLETGIATYSSGGSSNGNANGDRCEASVAGVLWDISDSVNDDQNSDGIGDTLSQTANMIWYVLRVYSTGGHGVYTIHEFWNGWFNYYAYNQEMWAVFYEHGINKDSNAPSNPSSYLSSHTANSWSNDNTIWVEWSGASDDLSGVYGYSYSWTTTPTMPDTTVDTTGTSVTSPALSNGWWYLNIRTRDRAGNWNSGYVYCGPFGIDTVNPTNPSSYTSSHTVNIWSADNTIYISWSGASDSLSGVYGYSFVWDNSPSTIPDTSVDTTGTSTTSPSLSDGSWYFHVRARDNASNWASGAYHIGPFYIDTTPPNNPTYYTSSHTADMWSNDNTIFISWSGASDGGSGVYGYSILWSNSPMSPDTTVDTTGTSVTSSPLSDGWWYLNIRTRDNVGNWADYYVYCGPFGIDTTSPNNPTSYSSSHTPYVWSNDNTIFISWSGASDGGSGVYGYSFVWDTSPSTIPDTSVDTTGTSTTSPSLSDGSWYFHVRVRDNVGNWASGAYHVGPFYIETVSPSNPTSYSSSHTPYVWSNDNTIFISWSGASDGGSGVYGYSFVWDTSPSTIPDTSVDTTGTSTTSPSLSDGSWYFHVRARDNASNWASGAYHVGPFYIDTTPPSNPSSYSSSHTPNVWSDDNTIFISWSGASDGGSGVYGYSFVWGTSPTTIPDTIVDTTGTSTTSSALSESGNWYFHVRVRDNVGNWASGAYHVGPFCIDDDISGPSIINPRIEDLTGDTVIEADEQFRFLVNLYDISGISLAEVHYDFDGDLSNGYYTLTFSYISGDLYGTSYIGPFASGDMVWQVYAVDGDNERSGDALDTYSGIFTLTIHKSTPVFGNLVATGIYSDDAVISIYFYDKHSNPLSGKTVYFDYYSGSSWQSLGSNVTDSNGLASITVTLSMMPGTYNLRARFLGDDTYGSAEKMGTLTVNKELTQVTSYPATATFSDDVVLLAYLLDNDGSVIAGVLIYFEYSANGIDWTSINSATTNGSGYATLSWTCNIVPGSYQLRARFPGNSYYLSSSSQNTLTIGKESVLLGDPSTSVNYSDSVEITSRLTEDDGAPIAGVTVDFYVYSGGSWNLIGSNVTDGYGYATVSYTANLVPGTYNLRVNFAGNSYYLSGEYTGSLIISKEVSALLVPSIYVGYGDLLDIVVRLTDNENNPITGASVAFRVYYDGSWHDLGSNTTNATGYARLTQPSSLGFGDYSLEASFDGNQYYLSVVSTGTLSVGKETTILSDPTTVGQYNELIPIVARITDDENTPTADLNVTFWVYYGGDWHLIGWSLSNGSGYAQVNYLLNLAPGDYPLKVKFEENANYLGSETEGTLTVSKLSIRLVDPSNSVVYGHSVNVSTRLTDVSGNPLTNRLVTFEIYYGGSWHNIGSNTTDSEGWASITYTVDLASGDYPLKVRFDGDDYYIAGSQSGVLTVNKEATQISSDPTFTGVCTDPVNLVVRLSDMAGNPLMGCSITFEVYYGGAWHQIGMGTTNSTGYAFLEWTVNIASGTYILRFSFAGDSYYQSVSQTTSLSVEKETVSLSAPSAVSRYGDTVQITSRLLDDEGYPVSGVNVTFYIYDGSWTPIGSAQTNASGYASIFYACNVTPGSHGLNASFAGDQFYYSALESGSITINREIVVVSALDSDVNYSDSIVLGRILDDEGHPVAGVSSTVFVYYDGSWHNIGTVITDFDGWVELGVFLSPGSYSVNLTFSGDAYYESGWQDGTLTVHKEIIVLDILVSNYVYLNEETQLVVRITDDEGNLVEGLYVELYLNGTLFVNGTTDANGELNINWTPQEKGNCSIEVRVSGGENYVDDALTKSVSVLEPPQPPYLLPILLLISFSLSQAKGVSLVLLIGAAGLVGVSIIAAILIVKLRRR